MPPVPPMIDEMLLFAIVLFVDDWRQIPEPVPPMPPEPYSPPVPPVPPVIDDILLFARVLFVDDWR